MNPILKSLLAEISPAFLRARGLRPNLPAPPEAAAARQPEPREPVAQRPCYRPPRPDSRDTASNM